MRSDGGRLLTAIRDNETRCEYLGGCVSRVRILLLVAMAAVAGLAGFGYGAFSGVVAPELTGFVLGTELIIWVALGGRGTLWGPLIGAVLINVASAYLSGSMPFAWQLILGVAFVAVDPAAAAWTGAAAAAPVRPGALRRRASPRWRRARHRRRRAASIRRRCGCRTSAARFGSLQVLRGITLTARAGELVGLIGPQRRGQDDTDARA